MTVMYRALCLGFALLLLGAGVPRPASADRWHTSEPTFGIVDAGRNGDAARQAGVAWDRVVFLWQEIQPNGPDDWYLDRYVEWAGLEENLDGEFPLVAVVQGTPSWAAGNPGDGAGAVPTGLTLPPENPDNSFGQFMLRLTREFKGKVDAWVIWNEPDFRPGDSGTWWTWGGNEEDLFKLVRAGYKAVKAADPQATVVFPATAFYPDTVHGRELFLGRVLRAASSDPEAAAHGFYFDAVAVNLYCTIGTIHRLPTLFGEILAEYDLDKPIWLTETNCPIYDDASYPKEPAYRITTHEQAAFVVQSLAMARAAGYERIAWYSMVDHDPEAIADRWGLVRPDGSPRPAFHAFQVASRYLDHPGAAYFLPSHYDQLQQQWGVWRVVTDNPGLQRRVQVLWRSAEGPRTVRLPVRGYEARLVDVLGRSVRLEADNGWWVVDLPPARPSQSSRAGGYGMLGDPVLLVERGVPWGTPVGPLRDGPAPRSERYFNSTGYVIEDDRIWEQYWSRGGPEGLGAPVSYLFPFEGGKLQLFERAALFLPPQAPPRLLDLAGSEFLPFADHARHLLLAANAGSGGAQRWDGGTPDRLFERGLLRATGLGQDELPLGSLFKGLVLGEALPLELLEEARASRFFGQYAPGRSDFVARPEELPETSLLEAF